MREEVEPEAQEQVSPDLDVLSYDGWEDGEVMPGIPCNINYSD